MKNLRSDLKHLISKFNNEQKEQVDKLLATENNSYIINYSILAIALQADLVHEEIPLKEFYNVDDLKLLNQTDIIVAKILVTLSNKLNRDIRHEYETALRLDKTQPEFKYLVQVVDEYLYS